MTIVTSTSGESTGLGKSGKASGPPPVQPRTSKDESTAPEINLFLLVIVDRTSVDLEWPGLYEYGQCPRAQGGLLGLRHGQGHQLGRGWQEQSSQEAPSQFLENGRNSKGFMRKYKTICNLQGQGRKVSGYRETRGAIGCQERGSSVFLTRGDLPLQNALI